LTISVIPYDPETGFGGGGFEAQARKKDQKKKARK
jgi:hypothetical protein